MYILCFSVEYEKYTKPYELQERNRTKKLAFRQQKKQRSTDLLLTSNEVCAKLEKNRSLSLSVHNCTILFSKSEKSPNEAYLLLKIRLRTEHVFQASALTDEKPASQRHSSCLINKIPLTRAQTQRSTVHTHIFSPVLWLCTAQAVSNKRNKMF